MTLLGIVRCMAFVRGRTYVSAEELPVAYRIAIDSVPEERSRVLLSLIDNDGTITSKQYGTIAGVSRGTVYNRFEEMVRLGMCDYSKKANKTKQVEAVTLKEEWNFLVV